MNQLFETAIREGLRWQPWHCTLWSKKVREQQQDPLKKSFSGKIFKEMSMTHMYNGQFFRKTHITHMCPAICFQQRQHYTYVSFEIRTEKHITHMCHTLIFPNQPLEHICVFFVSFCVFLCSVPFHVRASYTHNTYVSCEIVKKTHITQMCYVSISSEMFITHMCYANVATKIT